MISPVSKSKKEKSGKSQKRKSKKKCSINKALKVLVVDDEIEIIKIMKKILIRAGHKDIKTRRSGKEALTLLKSFKPDIIFLDIFMPNMNGEQVFIKIKKMGIKTFVVFISGQTEVNRDRLVKQGAFELLAKPFNVEEIFNIINKIARKK